MMYVKVVEYRSEEFGYKRVLQTPLIRQLVFKFRPEIHPCCKADNVVFRIRAEAVLRYVVCTIFEDLHTIPNVAERMGYWLRLFLLRVMLTP